MASCLLLPWFSFLKRCPNFYLHLKLLKLNVGVYICIWGESENLKLNQFQILNQGITVGVFFNFPFFLQKCSHYK